MRTLPASVRAGGLAALASLTMACNAILGVEDVAALGPDAGPSPTRPSCDVASHFGQVTSDSSSLLSHTGGGDPDLLIQLNTDPKPDSLFMALFDGMGGHDGTLNAPGTYTLTTGDAKIETCGLCLEVSANFDSSTNTFSQTFWADSQGTLTISRADGTGLAGRIQGLKFRHVNIANGISTDVNDGCSVTIDDVEFDMTYSSSVNTARFGEVARQHPIAQHQGI